MKRKNIRRTTQTNNNPFLEKEHNQRTKEKTSDQKKPED